MQIKLQYDGGRESDSIMQLKIFEEGLTSFHQRYKDSNVEAGSWMRKPNIRRSEAERQWCKDKSVDWSILKEVLILMEEIRHRFSSQGIPVETLNSRVSYDDEGYTILKIVIGGAFYRKYMKAEYKNETELKWYVSSDLFEGKADWCLIYPRVPEYVREEHIKKLLKWKIERSVEDVKISYDKPIVILQQEENINAMTHILKQSF